MVTRWRPDIQNVPVDEALTLVVAWRRGKQLEGAMVPVADEVVEELQAACRETLGQLQESEVVDYGPDAHVETGEYMAVPLQVVENEAYAVLGLLRRAPALDRLSATRIPRQLWFYAAVVGDEPERRTAFVRKVDPHKTARAGRFFTVFGEVLSKIEEPVFMMEHRFDLVVMEHGLAVINPVAFETLFRGTPELVSRIPHWAQAISDHLPIARDGADLLVAAAERDYRLARRLRSIFECGYLANVTIDRLRQEIKAQGLDEDRLIEGEALIIDEEDPGMVLRLLNEDLFVGGLSGTRYAADRKRVR
jgi:hypothetical protein